MVARGEFREDLLYRINLIAVHLPPLRERVDDIPGLASRRLQAAAQLYNRRPLSLSSAALRWLQAQPWPGNVRQLQQWVDRAVLVGSGDVLEIDDFQETARMDARGTLVGDTLPAVGSMTMEEMERAMIVKTIRHHGGNLSRVAESLGLSRAALYRRLEKYEIPT
jgi:DNA-binding NtrC family response regulator